MKKTIIMVVLLILVSSCIFAGKHNLKAGMTLYSFQGMMTSQKGKSGSHNQYGMGGNIGYEYDFNRHWFAGLDLRCVTNWIKGSKNLTDLSILPRGGYRFPIVKYVDGYVAGEYGLNFQYFEKDHSTVMEFGVVAGARLHFLKQVRAYGELENLYQFSAKKGIHYANIKLNVNLGLSYEL